MQNILMDGAPVEMGLGYALLGELLDELYKFIPEGRIIAQLFLDEREVLDLKHDQLRDQQLDQIATVGIVTSPLSTQLAKNISDLLGFLKEMRPILRQSSRELRFGSVSEASLKLADVFEGMETTVQSLDQLVSVLPSINAGFSEDELKHFSNKEGAMLGEIVADFQNKDWLSLADRLEFQLDPLMGRWQVVLTRALESVQSHESAAS